MLTEIQNYLQRIEDLHDQITGLIADLPAEALNWRPTDQVDDHASNSLAVLTVHVAGAEHFWIAEVIGRQPPTRDRDAEFVTEAANAADLIRHLTGTGAETRRILTALAEAELNTTRDVKGRTVAVRWALLHVIEHIALHLGHMQITYQLWQEGRSKYWPRWFERLGDEEKKG
ncbi:MAG: DUF664 domain-containing protein [Anaerolineaceae bacterium]|nr:DUF664 domain-containing protein [Anaerolineaceae bacterium]MCB9101561.1 DUF664 domain-containing protein [Anaerolineales bacterium]